MTRHLYHRHRLPELCIYVKATRKSGLTPHFCVVDGSRMGVRLLVLAWLRLLTGSRVRRLLLSCYLRLLRQ